MPTISATSASLSSSSLSSSVAVTNPFHLQNNHRVKILREKAGRMSSFQKSVVYGGAIFLVVIFMLMNMAVVARLHGGGGSGSGSGTDNAPQRRNQQKELQCEFREYPPRRYYGLQKMDQPDFLTMEEYIYGEYPIIVAPSTTTNTGVEINNDSQGGKICVDQSEWLVPKGKELPFADGTNPSILSLDRLEKSYPELAAKLKGLGGAFIATICMTNSQCQYQDTPQEIVQFRLSTQEKPTVVQTLLVVLDSQFQTLLQTTILLERDAPWGKKFKKASPDKSAKNGFEIKSFGLDDARLFIHLDKLWVSYREGPSFGYEQQVLNEIHMDFTAAAAASSESTRNNNKKWEATIKASESVTFCCGRNMALMEHLDDPTQLQSLTWADPVTVIDVDDGRKGKGNGASNEKRRRLAEAAKKRKSHFHGTNAFMVYLPKTDEFLGIGHFHRPHSRDAFNPYARFGHHYTHTFFTISSKPPFRLTRLSQEFILPSKSNILGDEDGEIIQFLSGLEVISSGEDNGKDYAVIAYGINDCEGAAVYMDMDRVDQLLKEVEEGMEVVDLMAPLNNKKFYKSAIIQ